MAHPDGIMDRVEAAGVTAWWRASAGLGIASRAPAPAGNRSHRWRVDAPGEPGPVHNALAVSMNRVAQHLLLISLSGPLSYAGYHALAGAGGEAAHAADVGLGQGSYAVGSGYRLDELTLLSRTLYYVDQRYVDSDRVDPELMFQAALGEVERKVPEVLFVRETGGRRLQVSVGDYETVLLIDPIDSLDRLYASLRRVAAILDSHVSEGVDLPELEYALINGALSTLDPHSRLLPPRAAHEMGVDNQGEFGGLGVTIRAEKGRLVVAQPMPGTPADKADLREGDRILRIEGESTLNMDLQDAVSRLRGEPGTPVTILIERASVAEPFTKTLVRARIDLHPVEGELLEGAIGYVKIAQFHRKVGGELDELLARFHRELRGKPLKGVILDLRRNPGGFLNQAVAVADTFLDDGVIVSTVEAGGRRDEERAHTSGTEPDYPVAVLVDGNSASASEIVAGALRNQGRAVIVGERTFGKGSVQHLYPNNQDDSSLKLTVAKYLTPGDHSIQSVGIPPDIALQASAVRPAGPDGSDPLVSLYAREWVEREASLAHHLEEDSLERQTPPFTVRYLADAPEEGVGQDGVRSDWEVDFVRELLLAAPGGRRAQILKGAGPVVAARAAEETARIEAAFGELGIDWSAGPTPATPRLDVRLEVGPEGDGALLAGESDELRVSVTNTGDEPVHQVSAVSHSKSRWLHLQEFYLGRIDPGETRTATRRIAVHAGAADELARVELELRTPERRDLLRASETVRIDGLGLPRFAYELALYDDGSGQSRGDGDGVPEPGEIIELELTVENVGVGTAEHVLARVHNESGKAVDLQQGRLRLGALVDPSCPDGEECARSLPVGESASGRLRFGLGALPESGHWDLELQLVDMDRYDYTTMERGGFYEAVQLKEILKLSPDKPLDTHRREPPAIQVSREPGLQTATPEVVLSGLVTDDEAVRDVVIFHVADEKDKVFYRGGEGASRLPFTTSPTLEEGSNTLVVIARDDRGLQSTWALPVWHGPVPTLASAPAPTP